jgi:hypothetical protein
MHVVELSLASMYHASISLEHWDTVFESTLFVINKLLIVSNYKVSPFEKLFHQTPEYQHLHTIGCECFSLLRPFNQHKLRSRSESCVFMGYSALHKGYKCLHIPTQRLYISRHVRFNEQNFSFAQITPQSANSSLVHVPTPLTIISPAPIQPQTPYIDTSPVTSHPSPQPPHVTSHSMITMSHTRSLKPKQFPQYHLYAITKYSLSSTDLEPEPTCYTKAVKLPQWRQAMASELDALAKNDT